MLYQPEETSLLSCGKHLSQQLVMPSQAPSSTALLPAKSFSLLVTLLGASICIHYAQVQGTGQSWPLGNFLACCRRMTQRLPRGCSAGDKWQSAPLAVSLAQAGVVACVMNYSLYPSARVAGMVAQTSEALSWCLDHAASLGGNPAQVTPFSLHFYFLLLLSAALLIFPFYCVLMHH